MISWMRPGLARVMAACALGAGTLGAGALGGCASGDGLLIEVVIDPSLGPDPGIGAIDVWVGEQGAGAPGRFVRLPGPQDVQAVDGWPFQILILPDGGPRTVWAGAFGYRNTSEVGSAPLVMGTIDAPVEIVAGELRHATITLRAYDGSDADCLFSPITGIAIGPADGTIAGLDCDDDGDPDDCDDLDPDTNHDAREICDGRDNNCDRTCDEEFDADGDRYSRCDYVDCGQPVCDDGSTPPTGLIGSCDCDDTNPSAHPGGIEEAACDAVDSDCDPATDGVATSPTDIPGNQIDDECDGVCDVDADGDLIATGPDGKPLGPGAWSTSCDVVKPDCDDADPEVYPNALERCDGVDNDCDLTSYAAPGICFTHNIDGECTLGDRLCLEDQGGHWAAACTPGALEVEDELCSEWPAFEDAGWPEHAIYDSVGDEGRATCTLAAWRAPTAGNHVNQLCGPRVTRLDSPFAFEPACRSVIAGGQIRGGWTVALRSRDPANQITGADVPSCDIDLVVNAVEGGGAEDVRLPSVWMLIIQIKAGSGETTAIPVELRVEYTDDTTAFTCPPRPFDCD
jgi:hypothetical protein